VGVLGIDPHQVEGDAALDVDVDLRLGDRSNPVLVYQ
jgi:hypothetical protein